MIVDASVVVTALGDDGPDGDRARRRLRGERLVAPPVMDREVTSAWRRLADARHLEERRSRFALADLRSLRVDRVAHGLLLKRCLDRRGNLTEYDAADVAPAELLDATLVTADSRLAAAPGACCPIEVLA